jgi:hypothetical protein
VNTTLKVLDLESNDIYKDKDAPSVGTMGGALRGLGGQNKNAKIFYFINQMKKNTTLISLNLANCQLDSNVGEEFVRMTEVNKDLIDFEFGFNKFSLEQIREI